MKSDSQCASAAGAASLLERPRYFPRQLITPEEMTLEQDYFRQRLRLHNRMLHGWGVVCGARVCLSLDPAGNPVPWKVVVEPGYVLGPYGDEIVLDRPVELDLRRPQQPAQGELDPWCKVPSREPEAGQPIHVAVKYKECQSRPVRVPPLGCGCDETQCEHSRWLDGYELGLLDECPASQQMPAPSLEHLFRDSEAPACPECPQEPWVVLAKVTVNENGGVGEIDNCSCRRMVIAWGHLWWRCQEGPQDGDEAMAIADVELEEGKELRPGVSQVTMHIRGRNLPASREEAETLELSLGPGVSVTRVLSAEPERLSLEIAVDANAAAGPRRLVIRRPDGSRVSREEALRVRAGRGGAPRAARPARAAAAKKPVAEKESRKRAAPAKRKSPAAGKKAKPGEGEAGGKPEK